MSASNPGGTAARVPPTLAVVPPAAGDKPAGATPARGKGVKGGVTKSLAGGKGVNRAAAGANTLLAASAKEGEGRLTPDSIIKCPHRIECAALEISPILCMPVNL